VKTLGLIGGTTWLSTAEYYRLLNEGVAKRLGGLNSAKCIIYSRSFAEAIQFNERQDWDGALELFGAAADHLKRSGAQGLVLCANTPHVIADRLEKRTGLPLVHIVDAVAKAIRDRGFDRVALLGTKATMELAFFRDRLAWHGVTAVSPNDQERVFIQRTINEELALNVTTTETRQRYLDIIGRLEREQGTQGAIRGCAEIPLLVKRSGTNIPVFDTTTLHAAAAVDFMLSP